MRVELDDGDVEPELADHVHEHGRLPLPRARRGRCGRRTARAPSAAAPRRVIASKSELRKRRRARQGAPPSACRRGGRGGASRAGSPRRAGCSRGSPRAELLDEPRLRGLRRRLEDRRSPGSTASAISPISSVRMPPDESKMPAVPPSRASVITFQAPASSSSGATAIHCVGGVLDRRSPSSRPRRAR